MLANAQNVKRASDVAQLRMTLQFMNGTRPSMLELYTALAIWTVVHTNYRQFAIEA